MPEELKLGKLPPRIDARTIRMSDILVRELLPPLPMPFDLDQALGGIDNNRMFLNDQYGCCVISARGHQSFRFEKNEQGVQIEISDQEIKDQYFKETGGGDWGLVLLLSMNSWRNDGWPIGGRNYNIYAFASLDWLDHEQVMHCIHLLGGVNFGMKVYKKDLEQFHAGQPWHLTGNDGEYQGGHGVYLHAYDSNGVICTTWGGRQRMDWAFWDARVDEAYGIVDNRNEWQEDSALDVKKLDEFLELITGQAEDEPPGCAFPFIAPVKKTIHRLLRTWKIKRKHV